MADIAGSVLMDMIRRLDRLADAIVGMGEDIRHRQQQVDVTIDLERTLKNAPNAAWFGTLKRILEQRVMGKKPTSQVVKSLRAYSFHRQKLAQSMRRAAGLSQRLNLWKKRIAKAGLIGAMARHALHAAAPGLIAQRVAMAQKIKQHRAGMQAAVSGGRAAALAGLPAARRGMALSSAFLKLNLMTAVVTDAFKGLAKVVTAGQVIVGQYWRYSAGGLRAMITETVGDFRRNIRISNQISDDMLEYARATQRMKDAFAPAFAGAYQFILRAGTRIAGAIADIFEGVPDDMKKKADEIQKRKFAAMGRIDAADAQRLQRGMPVRDPNLQKELDDIKKQEEGFAKELEDRKKGKEFDLGQWFKQLPLFGLRPDAKAQGMADAYRKRMMAWPGHNQRKLGQMARDGLLPGMIPGRGGPGAPVAGDPVARQKEIEQRLVPIGQARQALMDEINKIARAGGHVPLGMAKQLEKVNDQYWDLKKEWDRLQQQIFNQAGGKRAMLIHPDPNFLHEGARRRGVTPGTPAPVSLLS